MKFDDDIWPQLQASGQTWKFRPRYDGPITLIELHSTRGGVLGHTAAQEYEATKNWFLSPNNVQDNGRWGACSSVIIGGGKICQVMPDNYWPSFCLGHADPVALAIEIGQTTNATPFDPRDLDLAARYCAEKSRQYNIPVRVLDYLSVDNHEAPGYVRHDRSANGRVYGKSDPGMLFNDRAFEQRVNEILGAEENDDMITHNLYFQAQPVPLTWLVQYYDGIPLWKRYINFASTVAHLAATLGPPQPITAEQLSTVPQL